MSIRIALKKIPTRVKEGQRLRVDMSVRYQDYIPTEEKIFAQIEEICSWGIRRPGYTACHSAEEYLVKLFEPLGLANLHKEPVPVFVWEPLEYSLVAITASEEIEVDCFPLPHSAGDVEPKLELALFDALRPETVKGRAALLLLSLNEIPVTFPAEGGTELETLRRVTPMSLNPSGAVVDPGGTLEDERQLLPFTPLVMEVMTSAEAAGAAASVGVLSGHPGDVCEYCVPYDGVQRPFPGVWIQESDGAALPVRCHRHYRQVPQIQPGTRVQGDHSDHRVDCWCVGKADAGRCCRVMRLW